MHARIGMKPSGATPSSARRQCWCPVLWHWLRCGPIEGPCLGQLGWHVKFPDVMQETDERTCVYNRRTIVQTSLTPDVLDGHPTPPHFWEMSPPTALDADKVVELYERGQIERILYASTFALLLFEYTITFHSEVSYAWGRKLTWPRVIFFLNRYINLLQHFAYFFGTFLPVSFFVCVVLQRVIEACDVTLYVAWATFSGLQIYVIAGQSKIVAFLVILFASFPAFSSTAQYIFTRIHVASSVPFPGEVCYDKLKGPGNMRILRIAMHMALFLAVITEVVMIVIIGLRAWKRHCQQQQVMPWTSLILREGILHFVFQVLWNLCPMLIDMMPSASSVPLQEQELRDMAQNSTEESDLHAKSGHQSLVKVKGYRTSIIFEAIAQDNRSSMV
ncbi:hypothetical protein C8Q74DRAFT_579143 [Fomes fomentarius]|nr:hypothetical protein C8Q74DRAFT_579143 [Fomes fomentarius]